MRLLAAALAVLGLTNAAADTTYIPGYRSNYTLARQADGRVTVQRLRDGGIEATLPAAAPLTFQDAQVFFDATGVEAQAYRVYQAAFNRQPDAAGLGFWIGAMRNGVSLLDVAHGFYGSAEFQSAYGQVTDSQFLTLLYKNVLKRAPDQDGLDFWVKAMQSGVPRALVLREFSESLENRNNVASAIADGVSYYPSEGTGYTAPLQSFNPAPTPQARSSRQQTSKLADLVGNYTRPPVENYYHVGKLALTSTGLVWQNGANQTWTLRDDLAHGQLLTDSSSPYYGTDHGNITLVYRNGSQVGIRVQGELFLREGVSVAANETLQESKVFDEVGLTGFAWIEADTPPPGYAHGFTQYLAMYPAIDRTMDKQQVGTGMFVHADNSGYTKALLPPDNQMRASNPNAGPTWQGLFQSIEGGPGGWGNTQYPVVDPKFWIVGTPDGYANSMNSPGWGFGNRQALSRDLMSIAQLSNRLLTPPDGFTFRSGTSGEFFGYGWMALPLTDQRSSTVPIGNQSWTLFFNASNFSGPVAFWVPDAFARLSKTWADAAGRGLDAQPGVVHGTVVEFNMTPGLSNADATGTRYARNARLLFPVDAERTSWLMADRVHYSADALFEPVRKWFAGGAVASGAFARGASHYMTFNNPNLELYYATKRVQGLEQYVTATSMKTPGGGSAFGLKWTSAATAGVLPEYFRQVGNDMQPVAAADVPAETLLTESDFMAPARRGESYVSSDSWLSPAPAAGPFSAQLSDGSLVTYYWYKFIDQPSLQGFGWSSAEKAKVQARVELLHRNWAGTRDFMAPPTAGTLATMDSALLVTPPAGLEAGYVPVVARQELSR